MQRWQEEKLRQTRVSNFGVSKTRPCLPCTNIIMIIFFRSSSCLSPPHVREALHFSFLRRCRAYPSSLFIFPLTSHRSVYTFYPPSSSRTVLITFRHSLNFAATWACRIQTSPSIPTTLRLSYRTSMTRQSSTARTGLMRPSSFCAGTATSKVLSPAFSRWRTASTGIMGTRGSF